MLNVVHVKHVFVLNVFCIHVLYIHTCAQLFDTCYLLFSFTKVNVLNINFTLVNE